jgi:hypothetical protein
MKKGIIALSLFVGLLLMSISAMAQAPNNNLVQNGSFEAGYEGTTQINGGWPSIHGFWAPIGYGGSTDTIPAWTVSGGGAPCPPHSREGQARSRGRRLGPPRRAPSPSSAWVSPISWAMAPTRSRRSILRIEQDVTAVRPVVKTGDTHRTLSADHLICTVPFPVPPERRDRAAAPGREAAGDRGAPVDLGGSVFLQTWSRFCESQGLSGLVLTDWPWSVFDATPPAPMVAASSWKSPSAPLGLLLRG